MVAEQKHTRGNRCFLQNAIETHERQKVSKERALLRRLETPLSHKRLEGNCKEVITAH